MEMLQNLLHEIVRKERIIREKKLHRKHVNYSYHDTSIPILNRITDFNVQNLPLLKKYEAVYSENKISIPLKFGPNKKAQIEAVSYDKLYLLKKELNWSLVMTSREINKNLQFGYVNSEYVSLKYE